MNAYRKPGQMFVYHGTGQHAQRVYKAHGTLSKGVNILDNLPYSVLEYLLLSWGYTTLPQKGLIPDETSDIFGGARTQVSRKPLILAKLKEIYNLG